MSKKVKVDKKVVKSLTYLLKYGYIVADPQMTFGPTYGRTQTELEELRTYFMELKK